jgi:hypothetical protein
MVRCAGLRFGRGGHQPGHESAAPRNIVAELQAKQVIRMHQQPGYHRTATSPYLVPDADSILRTWLGHGWRHAVGESKSLVP